MRQQCRKLDAERHVAASDRCQHDNQQHQQAKGQRSAVKVRCAYGEPSPAEQPVNHRVERANQHNQQHRIKEQQRNQNQHLARPAAKTRILPDLLAPPGVQPERRQTQHGKQRKQRRGTNVIQRESMHRNENAGTYNQRPKQR